MERFDDLIRRLFGEDPGILHEENKERRDDDYGRVLADALRTKFATCDDNGFLSSVLPFTNHGGGAENDEEQEVRSHVRRACAIIVDERLKAKTSLFDAIELCITLPHWLRSSSSSFDILQTMFDNCAIVDFDDGALLGTRFGSTSCLVEEMHDRMTAFLNKNVTHDSALALFNIWNRFRSGWKKRVDKDNALKAMLNDNQDDEHGP